MPNRLASEDSPYLLQHQHDPVDWHAWGDDAFVLAKEQDKPVFLSVGYSSCHWCHVMAHESFSDPETASVLNKHFVSIKVDREERPDVDDAYMTAVQLATGHGGWPMSVFLTPDKKPFFAGTYFPREARGDFPGFRTLVTSLGQAWRDSREEIDESALRFAETLESYLGQSAGPLSPVLDVRLIDKAIEELHEEFDFENGGFGRRPKFPPHATVRLMTEYAGRRHLLPNADESLIEQAGHMSLMTLERMALGGIHDHVGGGFHRYSTDESWLLPHFEKMTTDNALLLAQYATASEWAGDECMKAHFRRTCAGIVRWLRSMRTDDGLFMTAVDADSEGEEGLFTTWTVSEVREALGERADTFCQVFGLEEDGNFRDEATGEFTGRNVLKLDQDVEGAFDADLALLRERREAREHPLVDDKCLLSANGLVISGLALAGEIDLASACADRWLHEVDLPHQITRGRSKGLAFLDDYSYFANGLLDLYGATYDKRWRQAADDVAWTMVRRFREGDRFYSTTPEHEKLFGRTVPALDNATPSPVAEAARALYRLGRFDEARRTLLDSLGWMQRTSRAAHSLVLLAFEDMIDFPDADRGIGKAVLQEVSVRLEPREAQVDDQGWAHTEVVLQIPEGMHINSNDPTAKWLTPTALHVEGVLGEASFPSAVGDIYRGDLRIPLRLRPKKGTEEYELRVRYQPCTETECLLPQETVLVGVVIVPSV
jgi:uncharacterized protein YyaL (SSP411 family)